MGGRKSPSGPRPRPLDQSRKAELCKVHNAVKKIIISYFAKLHFIQEIAGCPAWLRPRRWGMTPGGGSPGCAVPEFKLMITITFKTPFPGTGAIARSETLHGPHFTRRSPCSEATAGQRGLERTQLLRRSRRALWRQQRCRWAGGGEGGSPGHWGFLSEFRLSRKARRPL